MKKIKLYSYTILLILSMLVVSPWIFKEIWESSQPQQPSNNTHPEITTPDTHDDELSATTTTTTAVPDMQNPATTTTTVTTQAPYTIGKSDISYFDDALFIGDSRTAGLYDYGTFKNTDFFCNTGMSVYNLNEASEDVRSVGKTNLENLLTGKQYGKIYFMLGINELGYDLPQTIQKYHEWIIHIHEVQPDAVIYIQANLHVTQKRSDSDSIFNNTTINYFNDEISKFADNEKIFFIDVNELFDDENGNLRQDYSNDDTHVYAKHYSEWCDWLSEHTIIFADSNALPQQ